MKVVLDIVHDHSVASVVATLKNSKEDHYHHQPEKQYTSPDLRHIGKPRPSPMRADRQSFPCLHRPTGRPGRSSPCSRLDYRSWFLSSFSENQKNLKWHVELTRLAPKNQLIVNAASFDDQKVLKIKTKHRHVIFSKQIKMLRETLPTVAIGFFPENFFN